jgi:hypothetical protein
MDRQNASSSVFWIRARAVGIAAVFPLLVWFVAAASAAIDLTLAVVAAIAWCIWLDRNGQR